MAGAAPHSEGRPPRRRRGAGPGLRRQSVLRLLVVLAVSTPVGGIGAVACSSFGASPSAPPGPSPDDAATSLDVEAGSTLSAFCRSIDDAGLVFCDSFDTTGLAEWVQADNDPATRYAVETSSYASAPGSARCSITEGNDNSQDARLRRKMPGTYSKVEISGVTRRTEGGNEVLQFAVIDLSGAIFFLRMNGELKWRSTGSDASAALLVRTDASLAEDFIAFSIVVDLVDKTISWRLGDGAGVTAPLPALLDRDRAEVTVNLGPAESTTKTGWSVLYDNIVVRGTPPP
jgi:hypothetical protein